MLVTLLGWQGGQGCCNISCLGTRFIPLPTSARPWFGSCWLGCRRAGRDGAAVVSPKRIDTMHRPTSGAGVWNPTDPSASVALTTLKSGSPPKQKRFIAFFQLFTPSPAEGCTLPFGGTQALAKASTCSPLGSCFPLGLFMGPREGSHRHGSDLAPPTLRPVTLMASDLGCCGLRARLGRAAAHEVMSP